MRGRARLLAVCTLAAHTLRTTTNDPTMHHAHAGADGDDQLVGEQGQVLQGRQQQQPQPQQGGGEEQQAAGGASPANAEDKRGTLPEQGCARARTHALGSSAAPCAATHAVTKCRRRPYKCVHACSGAPEGDRAAAGQAYQPTGEQGCACGRGGARAGGCACNACVHSGPMRVRADLSITLLPLLRFAHRAQRCTGARWRRQSRARRAWRERARCACSRRAAACACRALCRWPQLQLHTAQRLPHLLQHARGACRDRSLMHACRSLRPPSWLKRRRSSRRRAGRHCKVREACVRVAALH